VKVSSGRDRYNHHIYRNTLEIVPNEAEIVCLIFEKYATGKFSNTQLAFMVNDMGFVTTWGNKFGAVAIGHILDNLVYVGINTHQVSRTNRAGTNGGAN
jgi:Recombinase